MGKSQMGNIWLLYEEVPHSFPKWLHHFILLQVKDEFQLLHSSWYSLMSNFLILAFLWVISHYIFILEFPLWLSGLWTQILSMRMQFDPWLCPVGWGFSIDMTCGLGHRHDSDPVLLCLWHRLAAEALIWPLPWKLPCAAGAALKRKKKCWWLMLLRISMCLLITTSSSIFHVQTFSTFLGVSCFFLLSYKYFFNILERSLLSYIHIKIFLQFQVPHL